MTIEIIDIISYRIGNGCLQSVLTIPRISRVMTRVRRMKRRKTPAQYLRIEKLNSLVGLNEALITFVR